MKGFYLRTHAKTFILENCFQSASNLFSCFCLPRPAIIVRINLYGTVPCQVLDLFYVQTGLKQSGNIGMTKDMGSYMTVRQLALNQSPETSVRACIKTFDKREREADNREKQSGVGENASISK